MGYSRGSNKFQRNAMIYSVNLSPISYATKAYEPRNASGKESQIETAALPIITTLGDQAKAVGDHAYAACIAGCNAALAAATLSPVGIVICFSACTALIEAPPLSA